MKVSAPSLVKTIATGESPYFLDALTRLSTKLVANSCVNRAGLRDVEDYDGEVAQCLDTRLAGLLTVDYTLTGLGEDIASEHLVRLLNRDYTTLVQGSFNALSYGLSVMERVWEFDESFLFPKTVFEKPFEWFDVSAEGRLYYDARAANYVEKKKENEVDTEYKFLLTRNKPTFNAPLGRPLLALVYWPYKLMDASWQYRMQFLARSGQPILAGYSDDTADTSKALQKVLKSATISLPKDAKAELLSTTNRGEAFETVDQTLTRKIQRIILGQTLTSDTGIGGTGSKALGDVHDTIRNIKIVADLALITPTIQNYIDAIYKINWPLLPIPQISYGVNQGLETGRANRDATLANSNQIKFTREYYIRKYGFAEDEFALIEDTPNAA